MEQTLALVIEQIEAGSYSYDQLVQIMEAMIDAIKRDWYAPDSACGGLLKGLERVCEEWYS